MIIVVEMPRWLIGKAVERSTRSFGSSTDSIHSTFLYALAYLEDGRTGRIMLTIGLSGREENSDIWIVSGKKMILTLIAFAPSVREDYPDKRIVS